MRGVHIVSTDKELIKRIKEDLAQLPVTITISKEFYVDDIPIEEAEPLRKTIGIVILDGIQIDNHETIQRIRKNRLWGDLIIFALYKKFSRRFGFPFDPYGVIKADMEFLRDFDSKELFAFTRRCIADLENPSSDDRFNL